MEFITHTGEIVTGERLKEAINQYADDCIENAHGIRLEDHYAPHITEEQKDQYLKESLDRAEMIKRGYIDLNNFGVWQRVNKILTGQCIPLFSK